MESQDGGSTVSSGYNINNGITSHYLPKPTKQSIWDWPLLEFHKAKVGHRPTLPRQHERGVSLSFSGLNWL